jgi:hypothetical protein
VAVPRIAGVAGVLGVDAAESALARTHLTGTTWRTLGGDPELTPRRTASRYATFDRLDDHHRVVTGALRDIGFASYLPSAHP